MSTGTVDANIDLVDHLVPGPSLRRKALVAVCVTLVTYLMVAIPTGQLQRWWNDRRHGGRVAGSVVALENPLGHRDEVAVTVIDGGRVFVWGGRGHDGGVIFDPVAGTWTPVPPPPGLEALRFGPAAGWTGREAVVWGGRAQGTSNFPTTSLAFDPATATWRRLPDAPVGQGGARSVSYPDGILFAGGIHRGGPPDALWFDAATETWSQIPTPIDVHTVVTAGGRTVAAGPVTQRFPGRRRQTGWAVSEFDPVARTWSVPTGAVRTSWIAPFVHDGHVEAVVLDDINRPLRALRWTGSQWKEITVTHRRGPTGTVAIIEPTSYPPVAAWTGATLVFGGDGGLVGYDPDTARFSSLMDRRVRTFGGRAVWTGDYLVATPSAHSLGWMFSPGDR